MISIFRRLRLRNFACLTGPAAATKYRADTARLKNEENRK